MKKKFISQLARKFTKKNALLLAAAALALSTLSASAQVGCILTTTWTDGTGSWFTCGNWGNGCPTSSVNAQINNGGTAQIFQSLTVAYACSLTLDSGSVSVDAGTGSGTLNVTGSLVVGPNSTGLLTLSNGATVNSGSVSVGKSGALEYNVIPATSGSVSASGAATLNATSTLKVGMTGTFTPGTRYDLLHAGGGVSGTFGTVSISYPHGQGFIPQISYGSKDVYLVLTPIP